MPLATKPTTKPMALAPRCACGTRMFEMAKPGFFECIHCDGPCHSFCDPEGCTERDSGKCSHCNSFKIGSRIKNDINWVPPKVD